MAYYWLYTKSLFKRGREQRLPIRANNRDTETVTVMTLRCSPDDSLEQQVSISVLAVCQNNSGVNDTTLPLADSIDMLSKRLAGCI